MPRIRKLTSDKYPPKLRGRLFAFLAENDGNVSKASKHFGIPWSTVDSLKKRYMHEYEEQQSAVREAVKEQAIKMRQKYLDLLNAAAEAADKDLKNNPEKHRVRILDVAKSMAILDRLIRDESGGEADAGQATKDKRKDTAEVADKINAFLDSESTEDSKS
jgi:transposase-like protein